MAKRGVVLVSLLSSCTTSEPFGPPARFSTPISITTLGVRGESGDRLGTALARVGDLDGDGFGDIAIGLPGHSNGNGLVVLTHGGSSGLTQRTSLISNDGSGAAFGSSLAFIGDVDADGHGDLAVGAPRHTNPESEEGRVYVYLGGPGGLLSRPPWVMEPNTPDQRFGSRVAAAGDFDGDGRSDLWVATAPTSGPATIYLYRGAGPSLETTPTWTTPGLTVAGAGDVNGDNRDDIVIGDPTTDDNAGRCDLWLGTDTGVPTEQPTRTWRGGPGEQLGASVAMAGDLDGDGLADFVCGAPGAYGGAGRLLVIFGDATKGPMDYGGDSFALRELGASLAPAGDFNADGFSDLIVAAGGDGDGQALVLAGSPSQVLGVELWRGRCVDCTSGHGYGSAVAPLGDIDGDGFVDIGIGAPTLDVQAELEAGALQIHLSAPTPPSRLPWKTWTFPEWGSGRNEPLAVAVQGDATNDGRDDLVIGEQGREHPSISAMKRAGVSQVWRYHAESSAFRFYQGYAGQHVGSRAGATVALVDPVNGGDSSMLLGLPGFPSASASVGAAAFYGGYVENGRHDGAGFGASVASLGDVDGDGSGDFGVGAPGERESPTSDRVGTAVVYGLRPVRAPQGQMVFPPFDHWRGLGATPNAQLGTVVAAAGDVDGDTFSDVLIAAPGESKLYLLRGGTDSLGPLERIDTSPEIDYREIALASLGDIDGDRLGDFAIGLPEADGAGRVLLFSGSRADFAAPTILSGAAPGDRFGASIATAGDIDADGFADVLIGAPGVDDQYVDGGRVTLHRGTPTGLDPTPHWAFDGDRVGASLGDLVVGGGDLDGDGFPDFGVVARDLEPTPGSTEATRLFVFRGNGATPNARHPRPTLRRVAGEAAISPYGRSNFPNAVSLLVHASSPFGSGRVRLETAITPAYAATDWASVFSAWSPYLEDPVALRHTVNGLPKATAFRWRTRVHYDLVRAPPQATSRWYLGGLSGQPSQVHFRTRDNATPIAAADTYACASDLGLEVIAVPPNAASPGLLANDSDADFDTLVASLPDGTTSGPTAHGTIVISREGGFRYRPTPGFAGLDRFRYRASDEVGGEATAEVTIVVVPGGCNPAIAASCGRGEIRGTLDTTTGPRGFACRVQVSGATPTLECDNQDGVLTLSTPSCE